MASQPIRVAPGGDYGDRKALVEAQQAAPMHKAEPLTPRGTSGGGPSVGDSRPALSASDGIFGPTDHPDEPMTAGVDFGEGPGAPVRMLDEDQDYLLRAALSVSRDPVLAHLLSRAARL